MKVKRRGALFLFLLVPIAVLLIKLLLVCIHYNQYAYSNANKYRWTITQRPFYSDTLNQQFATDGTHDVRLSSWQESITGTVELVVTDADNQTLLSSVIPSNTNNYSLSLPQGEYNLTLRFKNFTGSVAVAYDNFSPVYSFPNSNYSILSGNPLNGYYWDYILYIPEVIKHNVLLVVPNNTGYETEYYTIHRESAKGLAMHYSYLADDLGTPMLVPVFPRPISDDVVYTHALNRGAILSDNVQLSRLDLQLIAMLNHAQELLSENGINLQDQILMSGFSASGDFVDRFTFLHPDIVKAAAMGGCDTMVPSSVLNGENLPYPLGIYDYETITGEEFSMVLFSKVYRYVYKGVKDEGGLISFYLNGQETVCTAKEYYEKIAFPQIKEHLQNADAPLYMAGNIDNAGMDDINYRAFLGNILIDKFMMVGDIFKQQNLSRSIFTVYQGVGHEVSNDMKLDEAAFFKRVLSDSVSNDS